MSSKSSEVSTIPRTYFDSTKWRKCMMTHLKSSRIPSSSSSRNVILPQTSITPDQMQTFSDEKINVEMDKCITSLIQTAKVITDRLHLHRMQIHTLEISRANEVAFLKQRLKRQIEENEKLRFSLDKAQQRIHELHNEIIQKEKEMARMRSFDYMRSQLHRTLLKLKDLLNHEMTMNDR